MGKPDDALIIRDPISIFLFVVSRLKRWNEFLFFMIKNYLWTSSRKTKSKLLLFSLQTEEMNELQLSLKSGKILEGSQISNNNNSNPLSTLNFPVTVRLVLAIFTSCSTHDYWQLHRSGNLKYTFLRYITFNFELAYLVRMIFDNLSESLRLLQCI